ALASTAALRGLCLALGGWLPLVALLAAGQSLVGRGVTAGQLLGGTTYVLAVLQPALSTLIRGLGSGGVRYVVTVERLLGPVPAPSASPPCPPRRPPAPAGPLLDARGLTFAYGAHAAPVLDGLDLRLEPGGHLAVLGPSGIGKSTLAGLLCGLIRPQAGEVLLHGVPVTALSDSQLADRRVLIPQEAYVFTGSLWENLTYLRPDAAPRRVDEAVRAVGAAQLVARLGGWHAPVRPAQLSAGERQLIALVRAYLAPAPLAVLDEATCYLDPPAEAKAERAFAARAGALVVIAHRISSALRAPRLLVFDTAGPVVGSHPQVRERSPRYRELLGHWHAGAPPRVERRARAESAARVGDEPQGVPDHR
ncbi:MAG TPA: ABC transporter ATP-binding protein, partial [Pilimelia sp.]|nr:ABC transporter ATP-binding protein [Pilimelia sp.]